MLISSDWYISLLVNKVPFEVSKVKTVHLLIRLTVAFASSEEIHLILVHYRGVMRDRPWLVTPICLNRVPLQTVCLNLGIYEL